MKSRTTARRKRSRKTRSARKSFHIHLAGQVTSFFKRKNRKKSIWNVWNAFGKIAK